MKRYLLLLLLMILGLAACGKAEGESIPTEVLPTFTPAYTATATFTPTATPTITPTYIPTRPLATLPPENAAPPASVRVVHLNRGLGAIDVYVGGRLVAPNLNPGDYLMNAIEVASGDAEIWIQTQGSPANTTPLLGKLVTLEPNQQVMIYVYGDGGTPSLGTYEDNIAPLGASQSRITFVHASPDAPEFSVMSNSESIIETLAYGQRSNSLIQRTGEYTFQLQGTDQELLSFTRMLDPRQVYTVFVTGSAGAYEPFVINEEALPSSVIRISHASPDSPALRVYLDGELMAENLSYQEVSEGFMTITAGQHNVRIERMDAAPTDRPLLETRLNFSPDKTAELVIYDRFMSLRATLFPIDTAPTPAQTARLVVIHALPGESRLLAMIPTAMDIIGIKEIPISFGGATAATTIDIRPQMWDIRAGLSANTTLLFSTNELLIKEGQVYTYIVTGRSRDDAMLLTARVGTELDGSADLSAHTAADIRVVNGLAYDETIDVFFGDTQIADDVAPDVMSDLFSIEAYRAEDLRIVTSDGTTLLSQQLIPPQGERLTLFVLGTQDAPGLYIQGEIQKPPVAGTARLRFTNGLRVTGDVAVYWYSPARQDLNDPSGLANLLSFGRSEVVEVFSGDYVLRVLDPTGTVLLEDSFTVADGQMHDLVITEKNGSYGLLLIPHD